MVGQRLAVPQKLLRLIEAARPHLVALKSQLRQISFEKLVIRVVVLNVKNRAPMHNNRLQQNTTSGYAIRYAYFPPNTHGALRLVNASNVPSWAVWRRDQGWLALNRRRGC